MNAMSYIAPKQPAGTPISRAKRPDQAANGIAFVGVAAALQSRNGLQYMVFAADLDTLRAAWEDAGGALFNPAMAKPVAVFERHETPNVGVETETTAR